MRLRATAVANLLAFAAVSSAYEYTIEAIGPADFMSPIDLNEVGQVAFAITDESGAFNSVGRWTPNRGLEILPPPDSRAGGATGIADDGSILVNTWNDAPGAYAASVECLIWTADGRLVSVAKHFHARSWVADGRILGRVSFGIQQQALIDPAIGLLPLSTLDPRLTSVDFVVGVNRRGDVAGTFVEVTQTDWAPYLLSGGELLDIGLRGALAWDLNERGQVVGQSSTWPSTGFLFDPARGTQLIQVPEHSVGVAAVNDNGVVVGSLQTVKPVTPPGTDWSYLVDDAFVFDERHGVRRLTSLLPADHGWSMLYSAGDVNNAGQILGLGELNGEFRAFLMTPVPEPNSAALATCTIAACYGRWSRQRPRS